MRVIAGSARRLILSTPAGEDTRPTQDRIKETLFNMIQTEVPGSIFLDLCAGSGGIGIEALSRGAKRAYFVENGRDAAKCIADNLQKTRFTENGILLKQDALGAIHHIHEKEVDIIYIDPPYHSELSGQILESLVRAPFVQENTLIILETALDTPFTEESLAAMGLTLTREKRYKTQRHLFLSKFKEDPSA